MCSPSIGTVEDSSSALFHVGRPGHSPVNTSPVGGLQMAQDFETNFHHVPVLLGEVVDLFAGAYPIGLVKTPLSAAGVTRQPCWPPTPTFPCSALDQDPAAVSAAAGVLAPFGERASVRHARFGDLAVVGPGEGIR